MDGFNQLEKSLRMNKSDVKLKRDLLRYIRENNIHKPQLVHFCGQIFIDKSSARRKVSSNEIYEIYEQVAKACLLLNDFELAEKCVLLLKRKFGLGSLRIKVIECLMLEAKGEVDKAIEMYNSILESDDKNIFAMKRLVTIEKSKGNFELSIEKLNNLLKIHMNDKESMLELSDLYTKIYEYKKALFVIEDLIIAEPLNYFYYLKAAELLYTSGDFTSSRKYYSKTIDLHKKCVRAIYGLIMSCRKCPVNKTNTKLREFAEKLLIENYTKDANNIEMLNIVKESIIDIKS